MTLTALSHCLRSTACIASLGSYQVATTWVAKSGWPADPRACERFAPRTRNLRHCLGNARRQVTAKGSWGSHLPEPVLEPTSE
jgi:hypothetical protein